MQIHTIPFPKIQLLAKTHTIQVSFSFAGFPNGLVVYLLQIYGVKPES